jgi:hypothetical protein
MKWFDTALRHELDQIVQKLSNDLRQKALQGGRAAEKFIRAPDLLEEDISYILKLSTIF